MKPECERLRCLLGLHTHRYEKPDEATFLLPPDSEPPYPAILYCHAHGGDYALGRRELEQGAPWLSAPYAGDLLAAGYAVLSVDMPGFGQRITEGSENQLAKAGLWRGQPLFGQMVGEQLAALDWLAMHAAVDEKRIAALGTSMGGALAMWVSALDDRVAATVHLCMLADLSSLIATGVHDRHGLYLTVPGLLQTMDIGDIAALIAPRAQFVGHGADDPLTPTDARERALQRVRAGYAQNDNIYAFLSADTGHCETPDMRIQVMKFLQRELRSVKLEERNVC